MRTNSLFYILFLLLIGHVLHGQRAVYADKIVMEDIQLEGEPVVLASIEINIPDSGTVIVRFTGQCYFGVGDRMIMAASDHPDWIENDGHTEFETVDAAKGKAFSHTRTYRVGEGKRTFYAVGENAVETDGNGEGTIYGRLTVEYIPDGDVVSVVSKRVVFSHHDTEVHAADSARIQVPTFGQVIVRFDGFVISEPKDPIVLSASDGPHWSGGSGHTRLNTFYDDEAQSTFSHTDIFYVDDPGAFTYYAVIHNFDLEEGVGGDYHVYGNLLVEYYPYEFAVVGDYRETDFGTTDTITPLKVITFHAPEPGFVLLNTDGYIGSFRDNVAQFAVSDDLYLGPNEESVTVYQNEDGQTFTGYMHQRSYHIDKGTHRFYAAGRVHDTPEELDYITAVGNFSLKYFTSGSTAVSHDTDEQRDILIYPQPASESVTVSVEENIYQDLRVILFDIHGRYQNFQQVATDNGVIIDLSNCGPGMYFLRVGDMVRKVIKI